MSSSSFTAGALAVLLAACTPAARGQQAPALQHRPAQQQDDPSAPATAATGHTDLPAEAEGEYAWKSVRGDGEVELYFDGGRLHGYITEPQSPGNQTGAPLTFNFTTTHADGHQLSFTTRQLHGVWYSFSGYLERGVENDPARSGYYRLTGTLVEHSGQTSTPQTVSLPREPGSA